MIMIKAIDVFSGCGGVSCGLTKTGFSVRVAVDNEPKAVSVYKNYKPLQKTKVLIKDVHDVKGCKLLSLAKIKKDELYLMAGCPPCQNFSRQNVKNKEKSDS